MLDLSRFTTHRRGFLGRLAAGAAAFGLGDLVAPAPAAARASADPQFKAWLSRIVGKHKMVFDVSEPNGGFGFAWGACSSTRPTRPTGRRTRTTAW